MNQVMDQIGYLLFGLSPDWWSNGVAAVRFAGATSIAMVITLGSCIAMGIFGFIQKNRGGTHG